ncbi:MAG: helix-turn-helix transcriptional regulator, partial [Candidatus Aenigmarchaeota archaeon]|nr:helix-turn-helix transcriptional regulator [Candidatus Aenigmarchaeota archaeon]
MSFSLLLKLIGKKVKVYRRLKGIKQKELAKMINHTRSYISKIENGNLENLTVKILFDLSE